MEKYRAFALTAKMNSSGQLYISMFSIKMAVKGLGSRFCTLLHLCTPLCNVMLVRTKGSNRVKYTLIYENCGQLCRNKLRMNFQLYILKNSFLNLKFKHFQFQFPANVNFVSSVFFLTSVWIIIMIIPKTLFFKL